MRVPRRAASSIVGCLVVLMVVCCGVSRVWLLPCNNRPAHVVGSACDVQLAKVVCFITASNEQYDYESLRTGMCSHVVLIDLMGVGKDGCLELLQASSRALSRFKAMQERFRRCGDRARFMLSIGGVAQKSSHFSKALKTIESRHALTDELVSFNIKHALDGLDIAWFYPAQFGGVESDRTNLVVFLRDLHLRTKACDVSLSLTVGVDPKDIELSYDVPRINEVVDFVNLLTGDYHNPTIPTHISPLYGQEPRDQLNINYSVMSYIEAGLNPRKIVILNSCYAYLYISKINKNSTQCSAKLHTVMRLSFLSAREIIIRESFQTSWDDMRHVPYGTVTDGCTKKWITYNDVESVRYKAEHVLQCQLGGMGVFSVDEDDYDGRAGYGRYPILRSIVSVLYPQLAYDEVVERNEAVETVLCPHDGYLADPIVPEYYYICEQGVELQACPKQRCPQGQIFNEAHNGCWQQTHQMLPPPNTLVPYAQHPHPLASPQFISPEVAYARPVNQQPAAVPFEYLPLPPHYGNLPIEQPTCPASSVLQQLNMLDEHSSVHNADLHISPSTMVPTFYEPIQQPSNIIQKVVINPNSVFSTENYMGSASTVAPTVVVGPVLPPSNVTPKVDIIPNSKFAMEGTIADASIVLPPMVISEPAEESSSVTSLVVITPRTHLTMENNTEPSYISTTEASTTPLVMQHTTNLVPEVSIIPNSQLGEPVSEAVPVSDPQVLITPKMSTLEPTQPPVSIAPKLRVPHTSRKWSSGRRKSRARSHSVRTTGERVFGTETTPSSIAGESTNSVKSTRDRTRVRKTETGSATLPTTAPTTLAPTTTSTEPSTTITITEPPPATATTEILTTTTTTVAVTDPSTAISTSSSKSSTTILANVTFADTTTTPSTSSNRANVLSTTTSSSSSTWVIINTTEATSIINATEPNDTSSHLVTTVT